MMRTIAPLLAKAIASFAISGYAAHQLLLSSPLAPVVLHHPVCMTLTCLIVSLAGLTYYLRVWIQDYYVDWSYTGNNTNRNLTGHTAVVTGGTVGGLGFAAAELLYRQGATVILTVRTTKKGDAALAQLNESSLSSSSSSSSLDGEDRCRASFVLCDFLSESSVRNCAAELTTKRCKGGGIDFLILNAGISGRHAIQTKDVPNKHTSPNNNSNGDDDTATTMAKIWMTNHVGPWIFAQELMPSLIQAAKRNPSNNPRIVWVSSGAHKKSAIDWVDPFHLTSRKPGGGLTLLSSYGQSKLANIMHMREYQKRVRECLHHHHEIPKTDDTPTTKSSSSIERRSGADVKCFAITPGAVWTNMFFPNIPILWPIFWAVLRSPTRGAQVIKMACLDNDLNGGEYLSNCYVKESQGIDGCSNNEEQWKQLWELTAQQVEKKVYETFFTSSADKKMD
mmetsp:Transcript_35355/g.42206  ORF Transcript_35355/g.42206 Transcript_35355/m.42206 type:complete len:450 (+) Transcript_35355:151-1500(+)